MEDIKMNEYHILSLSGGKDSTALAFFMKENEPEIWNKLELVFCDTECELPETYDYLNKIEVFLNKKIKRIKPERSFELIMQVNKILPSPHRRWCTVLLKTEPFKKYVENLFYLYGKGIIKLYIGIRSDENNRAVFDKYNSKYIQEVYPFVSNNINKNDVLNILNNSGIGLPEYYKWISRSGCYFCFFKSQLTWIELYKNHPNLYKKAMELEQPRIKEGGFGWNIKCSLKDMIKPENIKKIKLKYAKVSKKQNNNKNESKLISLFAVN